MSLATRKHHHETQGKCLSCRCRFVWRGAPRLADALCPRCGRGLWRTTHLLKLPVVREHPRTRPAFAPPFQEKKK